MMKATIAAVILLSTIFGGEACVGSIVIPKPSTTPTTGDGSSSYDGLMDEQANESLEYRVFIPPMESMEPIRRKIGKQ